MQQMWRHVFNVPGTLEKRADTYRRIIAAIANLPAGERIYPLHGRRAILGPVILEEIMNGWVLRLGCQEPCRSGQPSGSRFRVRIRADTVRLRQARCHAGTWPFSLGTSGCGRAW